MLTNKQRFWLNRERTPKTVCIFQCNNEEAVFYTRCLYKINSLMYIGLYRRTLERNKTAK